MAEAVTIATDLLGARVRAKVRSHGSSWIINGVEMADANGHVVVVTADFALLVMCDDSVLRPVYPMSHQIEVVHLRGVVP